jgi:transcriptional regulator with XRE-family HTH domain
VNKKIGERIRSIRAMNGYSQDYLADAIGMSSGNLEKIERGEIDVNTKHLQQIAKVLKTNISELFEEKPNAKDKNTSYGSATKDEVRNLAETVHLLAKEVKELREAVLPLVKKQAKTKKK